MNCAHSHKKSAVRLAVLVSLTLAASLSLSKPAFSQAPPQNGVAMIMLPVQPGQNGQQFATTPRGMRFPLPGAGVNGNAVQVYTGPQGGYWYVDRTGNSITLLQPGQPIPNLPVYGQTTPYVPQSQPTSQTVEVNNAPSSGGSGAGGAMMAGAAGMMGGMALGAAMDGNNNGYYGGVPYGHPVYYGGAGSKPYYYGAGGKPVYVDNSKSVDVNAMQNQQNWYHNTVNNNPEQAKQWQNAHDQQLKEQPAAQQAQQDAEKSGRRGFRGRRGGAEGETNNAAAAAGARETGAAQQNAGEQGGRHGFRGRKGESEGGNNNPAAASGARETGAEQKNSEEKGGRRGRRGRSSEPKANDAAGGAHEGDRESGGEGRRRFRDR